MLGILNLSKMWDRREDVVCCKFVALNHRLHPRDSRSHLSLSLSLSHSLTHSHTLTLLSLSLVCAYTHTFLLPPFLTFKSFTSINLIIPQALDGFMMIVSREGRILYVSESIANYLGLRQVNYCND